MREATGKLIANLQKCDTAQILALYQVSYSNIDKENQRTFVKENILSDCSWYNKITGKYGLPNIESLSFTKDPQNQANIAILPLLAKEDTVLNLKNSTLYVVFYPDQFFNGRIIDFTVTKERIKINRTLIIAPPLKKE
jgi:hypothetical protein